MIELQVIKANIKQQMKQSFTRPTFRFCVLVFPIVFGFIMYMAYARSADSDVIAYALIGTAVSSFWTTLIFSSAGEIERERFMGTLESLMGAPVNFAVIILGKVIGNTIYGLISMINSFGFLILVMGVQVNVAHPFLLLISIVLSVLSYVAFAMMLCGGFTLSRNVRALMNSVEYPVFILCGLLFPYEVLPQWTRLFTLSLSPTYVAKLFRMSILGGVSNVEFWISFSLLGAITVIYTVMAGLLFKYISIKTRQIASLGVY